MKDAEMKQLCGHPPHCTLAVSRALRSPDTFAPDANKSLPTFELGANMPLSKLEPDANMPLTTFELDASKSFSTFEPDANMPLTTFEPDATFECFCQHLS